MNNISMRKQIADTGVVNEVTCTRQSYYTCDHAIFMTRRYLLNNSDVIYDKKKVMQPKIIAVEMP